MSVSKVKGEEYVLITRNKTNSKFEFRPKDKNSPKIWKDESDIIDMMKDKETKEGDMFHTRNEGVTTSTGATTLTTVTVVDGHLKSVNNDTKVDNIGELDVDESK